MEHKQLVRRACVVFWRALKPVSSLRFSSERRLPFHPRRWPVRPRSRIANYARSMKHWSPRVDASSSSWSTPRRTPQHDTGTLCPILMRLQLSKGSVYRIIWTRSMTYHALVVVREHLDSSVIAHVLFSRLSIPTTGRHRNRTFWSSLQHVPLETMPVANVEMNEIATCWYVMCRVRGLMPA